MASEQSEKNDATGPNVGWGAMIRLSSDDFGGCIMRGAARGFKHFLGCFESSHTKVGDLDVAVLIKEEIFRFQISMTDVEAVTIVDTMNDLTKVVDGFSFFESPLFDEIVEEFTSFNVFEYEIAGKRKKGLVSKCIRKNEKKKWRMGTYSSPLFSQTS